MYTSIVILQNLTLFGSVPIKTFLFPTSRRIFEALYVEQRNLTPRRTGERRKRRNENIKIFQFSERNQTHNHRIYSRTLVLLHHVGLDYTFDNNVVYFYSFTMYCACRRVGKEYLALNSVIQCSVPHFPNNFRDIAC